MTGLEQIKTAAAETLRAAGMRAVTEYEPERLGAYDEAVAVIGVKEAESRELGFISYLGESLDEERGTVVERYAKRMEAVLSLDIYAPRSVGASGAETAMERAAALLTEGLPSGLRIGRAAWGQAEWDQRSGMFLRRGTLDCQALLIAEADPEEDGLILDFILKGVMKHERNFA